MSDLSVLSANGVALSSTRQKKKEQNKREKKKEKLARDHEAERTRERLSLLSEIST